MCRLSDLRLYVIFPNGRLVGNGVKFVHSMFMVFLVKMSVLTVMSLFIVIPQHQLINDIAVHSRSCHGDNVS